MHILIAPSLLAADFRSLEAEIRRMEDGGADWIHVDVMDGHFVPNISMGPFVVEWTRKITDLPIDVHLMITHPDQYIRPFVSAGADQITIHVESEGDTGRTLQTIRDTGSKAGVAISPETPVERALPHLRDSHLLLVMTVHPGFGGQQFIAGTMDKIQTARAQHGNDLHIQVDGGIGMETAATAAAAGADVLVAGTGIFRAEDPVSMIQVLRDEATRRFAGGGPGHSKTD